MANNAVINYGNVRQQIIIYHAEKVILYPNGHKAIFLAPPPSRYGLIGRVNLLRKLKRQLLSHRKGYYVALTGLPGVGKTALALKLAHDQQVQNHFQDGVLWAGLGPDADVLTHMGIWALALGIPSDEIAKLGTIPSRAKAITAAIGMRRMLLIIDDACELETALSFQLGGSNCMHLVTTRSPDIALHFAGGEDIQVQELTEAAGLKLLTQLAPTAVESAPDKAQQLIRLVGYLPLALILMGNYLRIKTHSGQKNQFDEAIEKLYQVEGRLELREPQTPSDPHPNLPPHVSVSLDTVIGVGYDALDERSRLALQSLSIFRAKPITFSVEAALAVALVPVETLYKLSSLGFLEGNKLSRYTLHQTIADYAKLKLANGSAYERMANFFADYIENHQTNFTKLDIESDNIAEALTIAHERNIYNALVRGANTILKFLEARGLYERAEGYLNQALQNSRASNDTVNVVTTLINLGKIVLDRGMTIQAKEHLQEALRLSYTTGDVKQITDALTNLGEVAIELLDYAEAEKHLLEGLQIAREIHYQEGIVALLMNLSTLEDRRGNFLKSEEYASEGLIMARSIEDGERISALLSNLAAVASKRGDYSKQEQYFQESLSLARLMNNRHRISRLIINLGGMAINRGDYPQAGMYLEEGLGLAREIGNPKRIIHALSNLGILEANRGNNVEAEHHLAEGLKLAREIEWREEIGHLLAKLGAVAGNLKNYTKAEEYLQESLQIARESDPNENMCEILKTLGWVISELGDLTRAETNLLEGLHIARKIEHGWYISATLNNLGDLRIKQQEIDLAQTAFFEAKEIGQKIQSQDEIAHALHGLGRVEEARGNCIEARRLGKESLALFKAIPHHAAAEVEQWLAGLPCDD